jgi:GT2 family glycosyltransferase
MADEQVARLQRAVASLRERIAFIEGSRFWEARRWWMRAKAAAGFKHDPAPPGIPARDWAELLAAGDPYGTWLLDHEPRPVDLKRLARIVALLPAPPSIALVLDDADAPGAELAGFTAQAYGGGVLVRTSEAAPGASLVARSNAALARATAEFVAFCDLGMVLAPAALADIAVAAALHADADVLYGDFDRVDAAGKRSAPRFLPGWSPETLLSYDYLGPFVVYRRSALEAAGGLREGFPGAEHYDLALRVTGRARAVVHTGSLLWHRREPWPAGAAGEQAKEAAAAAVARRGEPAEVVPIPGLPQAHDVRYAIAGAPLVEIVIPTRDHAEDLERCLESIAARSTYQNYRITVVDNQSREARLAQLLEAWRIRLGGRFEVVRYDRPFNFAAIVNLAARAARAPYLLLLNNDTEAIAPDWIEALLEEAQRPAIGAVGARLHYPDGTIQHAGVVLGEDGLASHVARGAVFEDKPELAAKRNYAALTAACMMLRREVFERAGGFDESFAGDYNDVDFCLRLLDLGFRNVYVPRAALYHFESRTRGDGDTPEGRKQRRIESERFLARRPPGFRDPYRPESLDA